MERARPRHTPLRRHTRGARAALVLTIGLAIATIDASPGWDSTGITAGLLLLAAGTIAAIAGDRPWLWALLVGVPTPLLEVRDGGSVGAVLALGFAAVGAAIGWLLDRWLGISPWGLIVFLLLGFAAGVLNVMRAAGVVRERNLND